MSSGVLQVSVLIVAMVLSAAGVAVIRRRADLEWLQRHHEVAGYFVTILGTLYAVLLAFAVFAVWSSYTDADAHIDREANRIADLSRLSKGLPEPLGSNVRHALIDYLRSVVNQEFPAMAENRDSPDTRLAIQNLWDTYRNVYPDDAKSQFYYQESVKVLVELGNYRRVRLFASHGTVPTILWYLLCTGALLLVGFTYFFTLPSLRSQMVMTGALGGFLAFTLLLIVALNSPFSGSVRVSPHPMQVELSHLIAGDLE